MPGDGARRRHRRGKRRYRRARADAGRYPDRPRANRRTVPYPGRRRLRRPRHQRPSRNLADPRQGLPPLARPPLLRGDGRRAKFGGAAIGAERDRGQGAFRCAGTAGPYPRRRARRPALSRPRRRNMAGGGDRRHRLAGHRQSAGPLSPRVGHEADADPGARRIDRDAALVPQRADRRRFRAGGRLGAGCPAQSRSLSGDRACRASRVRRSRPSRRSCGRCSIRTPRRCGPCRARIATCSSPPATAMCSPSTTCRACRRGFPTRFAGLPPAAASRCASSIPIRTRCCSTPPGR